MIVNDSTKAHAQDIIDYLMKYPEKHEQGSYVGEMKTDEHGYEYSDDRLDDVNEDNFCNTTMCIAGTSAFLVEGIDGLNEFVDSRWQDAANKAGERLGLDRHEQEAIFLTMDSNRALDRLRAVAEGDEEKFLSFDA